MPDRYLPGSRVFWSLPTVDLERRADSIIITAHVSGVQVEVNIAALDLWAVDQLRQTLLPEVIE